MHEQYVSTTYHISIDICPNVTFKEEEKQRRFSDYVLAV